MSSQPEFTCPTPEELGQLIAGYQVTNLMSSGIRGALYQAKQLSLDRTVTIKVLPPEIGEDPTLRHAFETEAKAMARLNDPNLVDVFDFGNIQGMLYIIMEHVPGRSLYETTHGRHVDQKESARLVADLCLGLEHAHQAGIVHRALNPHNVLINNEAQAKIVDFGIAGLTGVDSVDEISSYSAPETFQKGSAVDAKADIYSAGMILYELVVGKLPSNPYAPPSQIRPCRPELDQIVYRAIQPNAEKRYDSAGEMAEAIEEMLKKMGTAPTQEIIKTMMTSQKSSAVKRMPASSLTVAKPSNTPAIVVSLLTIAIIVAIVAVIIKSPQETADANSPKPTAQKPQVKPDKPRPTKPPKPNKLKDRRKHDWNTAGNKPHKPVTPPEPIKPDPDDGTEVVDTPPPANPDPDPPVKPGPPAFDIDAWLLKARSYMQNKSKYVIEDYDKALQTSIDSFERDVKRVIRRLDRNVRKPAQLSSDEAFAQFRLLGRIPEETNKNAPKQVKDLHKVGLFEQKQVDTKFSPKFTDLRITYVQGIDKQIAILKKEENDEHAVSLEEEIELTQKDMARFIRILRGQEPDPEPEPEDKKKDGEKDGEKEKDKKKEDENA